MDQNLFAKQNMKKTVNNIFLEKILTRKRNKCKINVQKNIFNLFLNHNLTIINDGNIFKCC